MKREEREISVYEERKRAQRNAQLAARLRVEKSFEEMLAALRMTGGLNLRAEKRTSLLF